MGNVATGLALVAKPLRFISTRFGDRQHSAVRLCDGEPNGVLKTTETEVSTCRNIATSPDDFWIERKHPVSPTFVVAYCALEFPLIDLEQHSLVLCGRRRWVSPICRSKNDVSYSD